MNRRVTKKLRLLLAALLFLVACSDDPDGKTSIAALTDPPEGFRQATPGMTINLPEDMGPHPAFRLEWWYLTANLKSADGQRFGVQWTLFRNGIRPGPFAGDGRGWQRNELWLAHAALSRPDEHRFADRAARGGTGQAGVTAQPFSVWIDHWKLQSQTKDTWELHVDGEDFNYRLKIQPQFPAVLNGERGFSAKSSGGGGSMYFSHPLQIIGGVVELHGEKFEVSGQGWFDREWSSQYLKPDQRGWDWMALHLDDGRHLMLFRVRGEDDFYSGTLVSEDGRSRTLSVDEFSLMPEEYRASRFGDVPVVWQLRVPSVSLNLTIRSWPGDYWNPGTLGYWEGPVTVSGSHTGEGYLEMTGYEK
ncbi:lipocalin-like domain-containing protein [Microbulbifer hydrolyticus]|uniref:Carotenoid 1,2-hydratase n=1 Tax=Microbulbifer hydrolyticus TaxID=48074 RepID=A0A6P1T8C0_9GAMM|nr:lipocalin-like domain-containing protein [Microbulbifer hydrolyticus]MBB5210486.1 putative secreted hydrolase [Microbulbifer hydrolyticus]QHQ39034.1 carotenoid 1,2-hydratase [Microbulbifer hydrolyticus]